MCYRQLPATREDRIWLWTCFTRTSQCSCTPQMLLYAVMMTNPLSLVLFFHLITRDDLRPESCFCRLVRRLFQSSNTVCSHDRTASRCPTVLVITSGESAHMRVGEGRVVKTRMVMVKFACQGARRLPASEPNAPSLLESPSDIAFLAARPRELHFALDASTRHNGVGPGRGG
jgi:hypothetical protein